ncbi:MAG: nuclear transport factor 2 family protein, partial [Thauera sp.]|nr:nuclear transport factor 2 family protein [Thauera sp.]
MDIEQFMQGYKKAWQERDEAQFCALFAEDGEYHNTPFAVQRGHAQLAAYWQRVKLQEDVQVRYETLATSPAGGIAHWHVTYQVASEELFRIWAQSTGTNLVARKPGDPLP